MEETSRSPPYVCVKAEYVGIIREKFREIRDKFGVTLREVPPQTKTDCGAASSGLSDLFFTLEKSKDVPRFEVSQTACRVQSFVDALCLGMGDHGDDSSYDSDVEGEADGDPPGHQDVSRTTSETLAAEYAEYVTQSDARDSSLSRLEFGLRLGYTEPLVRAALRKLGPNPAQNELLAELIRLGAQTTTSATVHQQAAAAAVGRKMSVEDAVDDAQAAQASQHRLRPIVIDGSNVAMSHGNKVVFSCRGIRLCVDWFRARGHADITVFVPKWRKEAARPDNLVTEQDILAELERERLLVFTPSRLVSGKRLVCYDDRYILRLAADTDGVVVSNDNYRDLAQENADFRRVVEERILMYSFVNDRFMPPEDPLGRSGPSLDQFLRVPPTRADQPPPCPYAKKCTYGNKCKFSHPERGLQPHKSVTERLAEQAHKQLLAAGLVAPGAASSGHGKQLKGKSLSLPLGLPTMVPDADKLGVRKAPLTRTLSNVVGLAGLAGLAGAPLIQPAPQHAPQQAPSAVSPATSPVPRSYSVDSVTVCGEAANAANLHRKLQRQLSLNPTYDPRLLQMRRAIAHGGHGGPGGAAALPALTLQAHQVHPSVSRIASAPDSYGGHGHGLGLGHGLGGSDAQLNTAAAYDWNQALFTHQARQRLHFHLAAIFPDDLVAAAMALYPDEVDPQKICGAILALQKQQNPSPCGQ